MKLLIIEGVDNTGKNTLISELLNKFSVTKIYHCEKPKGSGHEIQALYQELTFNNLAVQNIKDYDGSDVNLLIHNRSWYGEYVYGCMYRQNDPEKVKKMIYDIECNLKKEINETDIAFVLLLPTNPEFSVKKDDGLSISGAKLSKITEEIERFKDVFDSSTLTNKKIIYVNEGETFRDKEDILNEVLNLL